MSAATGLLLALTLIGCGGDDDGTAEDSPSQPTSVSSSAGGGLSVTDGITPEELVSCLTDAGLDAAVADTTMMGVEDPHAKVEVADLEGYDGELRQGASLWVFADPEAAANNASYITVGGSDDPSNNRFAVSGNVVRVFFMVTDAEPTSDEAAVLACMPS